MKIENWGAPAQKWKKAGVRGLKVFLVILCVVFISEKTGAGQYQWPMEAAPALTSTFGEYRPGRFHAGLDLKTWGKEGYPVLAVDDGYVWRVRTSPWGYGKVVYVKLQDGRTAVYAHLSGFMPEIAGLVEAEQERRGTYSVNLFLEASRIPVKRGQTVGFSGSTGIGVPHLHFELRDDAQRPLNALLNGFQVEDTIAPTIRRLAVLPLDAGAKVAGGLDPQVIGLQWQAGKKVYGVGEEVSVWGKVGIAVEVYDRADASQLTNRLAPCRLQLLVDSTEVFQTTYTEFGYGRVNQVELDRNFGLRRKGTGVFHNLFRAAGNGLRLYGSYRSGDGVLYAGIQPGTRGIALSLGLHRIQILAEDAAGNRSEATVMIRVHSMPQVLDATAEAAGDSVRLAARVVDLDGDSLRVVFEASADGGNTWRRLQTVRTGSGKTVGALSLLTQDEIYRVRARDESGAEAFLTFAKLASQIGAANSTMLDCAPLYHPDFAVVHITSDRVLYAPPRVTVQRPGMAETVKEVRQLTLNTYETVVRFDPETSGQVRVAISAVGVDGEAGRKVLDLEQQRVLVSGGAVRSADGMCEARFDSSGVYRTLFGRVNTETLSGPEDLLIAGLAYRLTPHDVPFRKKAELVLQYPAGYERPEQLGVYELKEDSTWAFVGNTLDLDRRTVAAQVSYFSTYALLQDQTPPEVTDLYPVSAESISDRLPLLAATVRDSGSGIGREEDIQMTLDDRVLIAEYDPERDRVVARLKTPLTPGSHRLEVMVRDLCGNQSEQVSLFMVQ